MTWHYEPTTRIFTRHPAPDIDGPFGVRELFNLPDAHRRQMTAIHEAGHAAVLIAAGIPFDHMALGHGPDGATNTAGYVKCSFSGASEDLARFLAAGERAQDRWLNEHGLWTPVRAWAVEVLAYTDRRQIAQHTSVDGLADDLTALHADTDWLLGRLWPGVLRLAQALDQHGHLDYAQAATAAGYAPTGR